LIAEKFPKGDILKGNVGTYWMNIVWDALKKDAPKLYEKVYSWTLEHYKEKCRLGLKK